MDLGDRKIAVIVSVILALLANIPFLVNGSWKEPKNSSGGDNIDDQNTSP